MRGKRKQSRASKTKLDVMNPDVEPDFDAGDVQEGRKKKRKLSNSSENKYACSHNGCGRRYSRAEHLYRHQLNHEPKQIYHCDFSGCDRHFVRQDLCIRHRERHAKPNSHLSRKDMSKASNETLKSSASTPIDAATTSHASEPCASETSDASPKPLRHSTLRDDRLPTTFSGIVIDPQHATGSTQTACNAKLTQRPTPDNSKHVTEASSNVSDATMAQPSAYLAFSNTNGNSVAPEIPMQQHPLQNKQNSGGNFVRPQPMSMPRGGHGSQPLDPYIRSSAGMYPESQRGSSGHLPPPYGTGRRSSTPGGAPSLPSFGVPFMGAQHCGAVRSDSVTSFASKSTSAEHQPSQFQTTALLDYLPNATSMPAFNQEAFNHMQFGIDNEFMGWLFNDEHNQLLNSPLSFNPTYPKSYEQRVQEQQSASELDSFLNFSLIPNVIDNGQPESTLSGNRRQNLLNIILQDFRDDRHAEVASKRHQILQGNHDEEGHALSLKMMQTYISSFWAHIHNQLPIMHRPTFSTETCPDLLLISMMALGASCLEEIHGYEATKAGAELSFFLAWHARHRILQDPDFLPPTKLWVFQALLLLEILEKLYSTRSLHERAHVHHATTITLMRRGGSLIGSSMAEFVLNEDDSASTAPGVNGSINTSGYNTSDDWWNLWISNEATRRAAFAAFILDVTHATMFGHSAVMVAHEMRNYLPCDEALWSAKSGEETRKLERSLLARGLKPLYFLEGLKKTLNGQQVRTNTFGRVSIMAGLLSVSWHMKMQDVRVSSIGVGKKGSWGAQLMHAIDHWKQDFDISLATSNNGFHQDQYSAQRIDTENVFESRTVLHHLAHMAMHVDIVDCQIFAGAKCLLGRTILPYERTAAVKRMKESWAGSAKARDATFYALRFLSEQLVPEGNVSGNGYHTPYRFSYSARDDHLLNRPWVLYFATLIVWGYGYALDGPLSPSTYTLSTYENKVYDMQGFLRRMGRVQSPEDLSKVEARNSCLGLLMLLRDVFRTTRWELLHEASAMLDNCIALLMPGIPQENEQVANKAHQLVGLY